MHRTLGMQCNCYSCIECKVNILQVAALAPLALLLVLEDHCVSIILCCGVVHHCSYTAHIRTCE